MLHGPPTPRPRTIGSPPSSRRASRQTVLVPPPSRPRARGEERGARGESAATGCPVATSSSLVARRSSLVVGPDAALEHVAVVEGDARAAAGVGAQEEDQHVERRQVGAQGGLERVEDAEGAPPGGGALQPRADRPQQLLLPLG